MTGALSVKVRALTGTSPVTPLDKKELEQLNNRCSSPEKLNRVIGIHGSQGMKTTLTYQDNDVTYGLVNTKPQNKAPFQKSDLKKEVWKPKVTT